MNNSPYQQKLESRSRTGFIVLMVIAAAAFLLMAVFALFYQVRKKAPRTLVFDSVNSTLRTVETWKKPEDTIKPGAHFAYTPWQVKKRTDTVVKGQDTIVYINLGTGLDNPITIDETRPHWIWVGRLWEWNMRLPPDDRYRRRLDQKEREPICEGDSSCLFWRNADTSMEWLDSSIIHHKWSQIEGKRRDSL